MEAMIQFFAYVIAEKNPERIDSNLLIIVKIVRAFEYWYFRNLSDATFAAMVLVVTIVRCVILETSC